MDKKQIVQNKYKQAYYINKSCCWSGGDGIAVP